jgi:hypothetical protein
MAAIKSIANNEPATGGDTPLISKITPKLFLSAMMGLALAQPLWAQEGPSWPRVSELTWMDKNHLSQQRQAIEDIAGTEFGRRVRGDKSDLELLQRIVDNRLIRPNEAQQLQALGAVLGDVYVNQYESLEWRAYEDEKGRSRAVCVVNSKNCVFPITMLSRRISAGLEPHVKEVYNRGVEAIKPYLPKRPFDGR